MTQDLPPAADKMLEPLSRPLTRDQEILQELERHRWISLLENIVSQGVNVDAFMEHSGFSRCLEPLAALGAPGVGELVQKTIHNDLMDIRADAARALTYLPSDFDGVVSGSIARAVLFDEMGEHHSAADGERFPGYIFEEVVLRGARQTSRETGLTMDGLVRKALGSRDPDIICAAANRSWPALKIDKHVYEQEAARNYAGGQSYTYGHRAALLGALADVDPSTLWNDLAKKLAAVNPADIDERVERAFEQTLRKLSEAASRIYCSVVSQWSKSADSKIRAASASTLSLLAGIDPMLYRGTILHVVNDPAIAVREAAIENIGPLASIDATEYIKAMKHAFKKHTRQALYAAAALGELDPTMLKKIVKQSITPPGDYRVGQDTTKAIAKQLGIAFDDSFGDIKTELLLLAYAHPDTYRRVVGTLANEPMSTRERKRECNSQNIDHPDHVLHSRGLQHQHKLPKALFRGSLEASYYQLLSSIEPLAALDAIKYEQIIRRALDDADDLTRSIAILKLNPLVKQNPRMFIEGLEKGLNDEYELCRLAAARRLGIVAQVSKNEYIRLITELASDEKKRELLTAEHLTLLAELDPKKYCTLVEYWVGTYMDVGKDPPQLTDTAYLPPFLGESERPLGSLGYLKPLAKLNPSLLESFLSKILEKQVSGRELHNTTLTKLVPALARSDPAAAAAILRQAMQAVNYSWRAVSNIVLDLLQALRDNEALPPLTIVEHSHLQDIVALATKKDDVVKRLLPVIYDTSSDLGAVANYMKQGSLLEDAIECSRIHVPGFTIIKKMGEGAFKKAYLAQDSRGYTSVLKRIAPGARGMHAIKSNYGNDTASWLDDEMFITPLKRVRSEYVAWVERPALDADGKTWYLVEEPYEMTLRQKLDNQGPLPLDVALRITKQIVEGLHKCHTCKDKQVIHHDLKPNNVGLDSEGNVKLSDFGQLKDLDPIAGHGEIINPIYAALEVLKGRRTDVKANIWTVGHMLYEMLTGEALYTPTRHDGTPLLHPSPAEVDGVKRGAIRTLEGITDMDPKERLEFVRLRLARKSRLSEEPGYGGGYAAIAGLLAVCLSPMEKRPIDNMETLRSHLELMEKYAKGMACIARYDEKPGWNVDVWLKEERSPQFEEFSTYLKTRRGRGRHDA